MNTSIRPAELKDNPFIQKVFSGVLPLYKELMPGVFEDNINIMGELIERELPFSALDLEAWILALDQAGIGMAAFGHLPNKTIYMASLHLLPEQQFKGFGGKALAQLESHYFSMGTSEIVLLAHESAPWAIRFYSKHGYRLISKELSEMNVYTGSQIDHLIGPHTQLMGKMPPKETGYDT